MDGVLTDIMSSWKYVHDYFGTCNDQSVDDYLKGEIDDLEFIRRDVSLWQKNDKPVTRDKLVEILSDIDTEDKRRSVVQIMPVPNSTINAADRKHATGLYRGPEAAAVGRISRYAPLNGLGGQGQQTWNVM